MAQTDVEKVRRELRRKSLDQIKVFNPLDRPFQTIYDGFTYVASPKSEAVFLRYIAEKWMREFIDAQITAEEAEAVEKENDKRRKKGWEIMNPQERDQFDLRNKLVTNDPERRLEIMKQIYRGITQEHGLDLPEAQPVKRDTRTQDEKLLEQLDKEMGLREVIREDEVEDLKDNLLKEISDEG
jgi:hypothetical protein